MDLFLEIAERFGLPVGIVAVMMAAFWRLLTRTLDRSDKQLDRADGLINNHLAHHGEDLKETARILKSVSESLGRIEGKVGGN